MNISLEFYETRIEQLEAQLKEKSRDLDRLNCLFEQKNFTMPSRSDSNPSVNIRKVVKFDPTSEDSQIKINQLENSNLNLKSSLKSLESKLALNEVEKQALVSEIESLKKDLTQTRLARSRTYEPSEFRDFENNSLLGAGEDFWKSIYSEVESLKIKLANAHNELQLREKEHELKATHAKHANEKSFNELTRRHKYEINKLIGILTGDELLGAKSLYEECHDGGSLLDDPIRMRLLLNSRNKYLSLTQTIDKQKEIISSLNEKLKASRESGLSSESLNRSSSNSNNNNSSLQSVVQHYEAQLKAKNKEIEKFRVELDHMLILLRTLQA